MKNFYKQLLIAVLTLITSVGFAQSDLIFTGVISGSLPGGLPKALEIYVVNDVADLSTYGIANANNGGPSGGIPKFSFPAVAATAGTYIYISKEAEKFEEYFGFAPDYIEDPSLAINGDDVMELYHNGAVVDYMGELGVDGTDQPWEYLKGWMYRNNETGPNTTFTLSEWMFSGINTTSNTTNADAVNPMPVGTYSPGAAYDMIFTGVISGSLPGGLPKALEIYVVNDVADISAYGIANANNGDPSGGIPKFSFPEVGATAGTYIYISKEAEKFEEYFGFAPDYIEDPSLAINGDDVMELYYNGEVFDYMGEIGVDGTGEPWEYLKGWMYRNNQTGPNTTFTLSEWMFSGINATSSTTNGNAANPMPIGTYSSEAAAAVAATIAEIQETTDPSGDSPMVGQMVITSGIVTGFYNSGFWIQDGSGAWNGIFVRTTEAPTVAVGDNVTVSATVQENYGLTRLNSVTEITVNSSANALPAPVLLTTGTAGVEEYESVLISVVGAVCTDNALGNGQWMVNDGSGDYMVDDQLYDAMPQTFLTYDLTGISTYTFDDFKLLPRNADDVVVGDAVTGVSFASSTMMVSETDGTVTVNVTITNPAATATSVDVVVSGGDAINGTHYNFTDPTTITFPAGSSATQSFTFDVVDDAEANADRTIVFTLQNAGDALIGTSELEVTIDDDDTQIVITDIAIVAAVDADGVAVNNGATFTVAGIVHGGNMNAAGLSFTIIDQTGGIGLYSPTPLSDYVVTEGDSVVVEGLVNQFNGLTQLTPSSIVLISQGNATMTPIVVTSLNENLESQVVTMECLFIPDPSQWTGTGSGFTVKVENAAGVQFDMRIDNDVDLFSAPAPTGGFNLTGIVGQFDNSSPFLSGYQIFPRYAADIVPADCGFTLAPVNDECTASILVSSLMGGPIGEPQVSTIYTNVDAGTTGDPANGYACFGEPDGGGATPSIESTVWFKFIGDGAAYTIETNNCNGTATNYIPEGDTQMAIYSGFCAFATPQACSEDSENATTGNYFAGLDFQTVAGETYFIMIDGFAGAQGEFCLSFTRLPLANDACEGAADLNAILGGGFNTPVVSGVYSNAGATVSSDDPNPNDVIVLCWNGTPTMSHTVWFSFTGDGGEYLLETTNCDGATSYIPDGDTQMAIFTGACGDYTQVACNEDGPSATSTEYPAGIQLITTLGVEYFVMVDGYAGAEGQFCMQATSLTPVGLRDINTFKFEVFPNPAHNKFVVDAPKAIVAATLTNVIGQEVKAFEFAASQRVELNVNGLGAGIYILQLRTAENEISTAKVVVD